MLKRNVPRLEVITGCMYSGKTEELIKRLDRFRHAKAKVLLLRPETDTRKSVTHSQRPFNGISIPRNLDYSILKEIVAHFSKIELKDADIIGFDEGNFFGNSLVQLVRELVDSIEKIVFVAGLDKTFANKGYGPMPQLIHDADVVHYLNAVCTQCGSDYAAYTQRLINGKPASSDSPQDIVGGDEAQDTSEGSVKYEARCRICYVEPT